MKTLSTTLLDGFQARASTLATLWKITRTDSVVMGFTNHSNDLVVDGVTYIAKSGYTATAIQSNSNLSVDNLELEGIIADAGITDADIRAGVYDYADVVIYGINYKDVSAGVVILRRGNIGELTLKDGIYVSEIRGMAQRLARMFIRIVLPECDAELYDTRCTVSSFPFRNTGSVTSIVVDRLQFGIALIGTPRPTGYFEAGLITFTSGAASGRSAEINFHFDDDTIQLYLRLPWLIAIADEFSIQKGCLKTLDACKEFNNILNFRGFPKVPGNDQIFKTPDVKL